MVEYVPSRPTRPRGSDLAGRVKVPRASRPTPSVQKPRPPGQVPWALPADRQAFIQDLLARIQAYRQSLGWPVRDGGIGQWHPTAGAGAPMVPTPIPLAGNALAGRVGTAPDMAARRARLLQLLGGGTVRNVIGRTLGA